MSTIDNILQVAKERGMNDQDLCKILGLSKSGIYHWKNGKGEPNATQLLILARYFNVSTDYLLTRAETKQPLNTYADENEIKKELLSNEEAAQVLQNLLAESKLSNPDGTIRGVSIKVISNFIRTNEGMLKELIDKNQ